MSRTLAFEMIQDTRFSKTPKADVSRWTKKIELKLKKIDGVSVRSYDTRRIVFSDPSDPEKCISYRKKIHVQKTGRKVTWDDIMGIINSVKAPHYEFI